MEVLIIQALIEAVKRCDRSVSITMVTNMNFSNTAGEKIVTREFALIATDGEIFSVGILQHNHITTIDPCKNLYNNRTIIRAPIHTYIHVTTNCNQYFAYFHFYNIVVLK